MEQITEKAVIILTAVMLSMSAFVLHTSADGNGDRGGDAPLGAPYWNILSPDATDAPVSGDIVIEFTEVMNTSEGEVKLDGLDRPALTGGVWSEGNTVLTIPYSGLEHGTAYSIWLTGFKGAAWGGR